MRAINLAIEVTYLPYGLSVLRDKSPLSHSIVLLFHPKML